MLFPPCMSEQQLQSTELQEKEKTDERDIERLFRKNSNLNDFFYAIWKHQQDLPLSDVLRGYRK